MDPYLYRAAELGNWDVIEQFEHQLETQQTSSKDTVLHVLSQSCDSLFAVQKILERTPEFLLKLNAQKETSLHIAARMGHTNIVQAVIDCKRRHEKCRSVLRSRNVYGNLALHEAIKNRHCDIVKLLLEEDPTMVNIINSANQSPLYLAAEKGDEGVVALILSRKPVTDASPLKTYRYLPEPIRRTLLYAIAELQHGNFFAGPNKKNAMHAAAIRNFPECLKLILHELPHLAKEEDEFEWNALHYAARFNHQEVVRELLLSDSSPGKNKALLVAVIWGSTQVIEELLTYCPDCWRAVNPMGKNAIHMAVEHEQQEVLGFLLRKSWASELVNRIDQAGNTPLHFYVSTKTLLGHELVNHPAVERNPLNKDGLTPLDLIRYVAHLDEQRKDFLRTELEKAGATQNRFITLKKKDSDTISEKELNTMARTYQVVATLIIGITFAAGFTIPGGYESNDGLRKGQPVFLNKAAFVAFIFFDFAALMLSWMALLRLLLDHHIKSHTLRLVNLGECRASIVISLVALVLTFVTGLYITSPKLGIRISVFIFAFLGFVPFVAMCLLWVAAKGNMYSISVRFERYT